MYAFKMQITVLFLLATAAVTSGYPGLLKVPKVYNALIKTNQNITPSRAFPVLQPIVQRTALGYVPPLYYPQFSPQFLPGIANADSPKPFTNQALQSNEKVSPEPNLSESKDESNTENPTEDQSPLKFYPNYQTLLYDPNFYSYSGLSSYVEQATYQDQQSQAILDPLPPEGNGNFVERLLPNFQDEKASEIEKKEKIYNVPPPPLPTTAPKVKSTEEPSQ